MGSEALRLPARPSRFFEVTVGLVEAFCKDKSAAPLTVELQAGRGLALQVLGALMMLWGPPPKW